MDQTTPILDKTNRMIVITPRLGPVDIHGNDHGRMSRQLGTEVNGDARYRCHAGLGVGLLFEVRAASDTDFGFVYVRCSGIQGLQCQYVVTIHGASLYMAVA